MSTELSKLATVLPVVENFPKQGIKFQNIAPLFRDVKLREYVMQWLVKSLDLIDIDVVVGIDARGFLFGMSIAERMKLPFVMARKPSKLPGEVVTVRYGLEYGSNSLEIEADALTKGQKVLIVDDILATGGSILAVCNLVEQLGAKVAAVRCLTEIVGLNGVQNVSSRVNTCEEKSSRDQNSNKVSVLCMLKCNNGVLEYKEPIVRELKPAVNGTKIIVLYCPSMYSIAADLQYAYPNMFEIGEISWKTFPDGYANIKFDSKLLGQRVLFIASLYDKRSYIDQLSVMAVLPRQLIKSLDILLPYYGPGTMERVETPGTLATADTYAQITSCVFPPTREGPPVLSVYDIHNPVMRFSFTNGVCFQPMSMVPTLLKEVALLCSTKKWAVVFPDEGSYKRFRGLPEMQNVNMIICGKVRDGNKRIVRIMDKVPADLELKGLAHAIITDDLVQTGGTLHECHMALKDAGVKKVSAYVTHAIFPNREYLHFMPNGKYAGLENFFITNSVPERSNILDGVKPFKVLSIVPNIASNLLWRYYGDEECCIKVQIASESKVKLTAIRAAFEKKFAWCDIEYSIVKTNSLVNEQPIGLIETMQGAENRLADMLLRSNRSEQKSKLVYWVSIENGIDPNTLEDFGVIMIQNADKSTMVQSDRVKVDQEMYEGYKLNKYKTVGEAYNQLHGYPSDNWHLDVSGRSRESILADAVSKALDNL